MHMQMMQAAHYKNKGSCRSSRQNAVEGMLFKRQHSGEACQRQACLLLMADINHGLTRPVTAMS